MTDGPTSRAEALELVATIVVRVARRMAEHDAAQAAKPRTRTEAEQTNSAPATTTTTITPGMSDRHEHTPTMRGGPVQRH